MPSSRRLLIAILATVTAVLPAATALGAAPAWQSVGPPLGGSIVALAIDSNDPTLMYAAVTAPAATSAGLYRTTDGGTTWGAVLATLPDGTGTGSAVTAVVADPSLASTVYLGTTHGVFVSSNRGASWTQAPVATSSTISALAIYNSSSGYMLYAATSAGALFRSSDRGLTWASIGAGLPAQSISTVLANPAGSTLYVGYDCVALTCGVYKSTNSGGAWAQAVSGMNVYTNPRTSTQSRDAIFALAMGIDGTVYAGTSNGLYRSATAAASWTYVPADLSLLAAVKAIVPDPLSSSVLYVAVSDSGKRGVFKSSNGGTSFVKLSLDAAAVTLTRGTTASLLVAGTPGAGVYQSADAGVTWTGAASGLPRIVAQSVASNPRDTASAYVATSGAGVLRTLDRATTWTRTGFPVTTVCSVTMDPTSPSTLYAVTDLDQIYKSTDAGGTWTLLRGSTLFATSCGSPGPPNRVVVTPGAPLTVYASGYNAGYGLYRSVDGGATLFRVSSVSGVLSGMAFDSTNPSIVYAITNTSLAPFKSVDGGSTFTATTAVSPNFESPESIVVTAAGTLIAAVSNSDDIYRSTDGGTTWTRVVARGNYLGGGARLAVAPTRGAAIYAAVGAAAPYGPSTTLDVLRSFDDGVTWTPFGAGLSGSSTGQLPLDLSLGPAGEAYLATSIGLYFNAGDTPAITSVTPASGSLLGGTRVTLTGANFSSGAAVTFGATAGTAVSVASASSLSVTTPAGSGRVDVTVTNPDGQSATSAAAFAFTCTYTAAMAKIQTVAATGLAATTVNISGYIPPATQPGVPVCAGVPPTSDVTWIQLTVPNAGPSVGYPTFSFSVDANPSAANRTGHITVDRTVYQIVQAGTASALPFGLIDTPLDNQTGLYGSIAVTGWALDDVEVTEVQIWRDPHPSDPPAAVYPGPPPQGGKVFVGYATMVPGARTDVEALYPGYPFSSRAGWGYLMLTRGLVWDGKGPFRIHAFAVDREGHMVVLGSKTIAIDNAASTKPFGAIDTPGQGDTARGLLANTGWVLTPNAGQTIPAANVRVAIDSVFLTDVPGMSDRADITAGFPQFNTTGAGRGMFVDTTKFADGLHIIGWQVTDSAGNADGIGSRFFTVSNSPGSQLAASLEMAPLAPALVEAAPLERTAIAARHGWTAAPLQSLVANDDDVIVVSGEELDRYELELGDPGSARWAGALRAAGELRPLPIGSHLDASGGVFSWHAAAGFLGAYDLVFVRVSGGGILARREIRVVVAPKGQFAEARTIVDTPRSGVTVDGAITIGGWAADPTAAAGTGIDAIHVWAYPADGLAPLFLGAATLGGARRDVADLYGERYRDSGYDLAVGRLAPGTYTIAVFAHSTATGGFLPATCVRVTVR